MCVCVCACIRSRVRCHFFPVNRVIYSSLCAFMPPKVNCAIYSAWLVYVCVRRYDLASIAQFRQVFPGESCYLQLAVCIFASQSELRHLQSTVSVCVCVDHLKRCKTSNLAGGNRVAAWLSPTKLHAVD